MLDRDLAQLYDVKPIALRQQVKRNKNRFPTDFMFQLTRAEAEFLVSQNVIPSKRSLGCSLPFAFTEQGVAMLSSVLNSPRAITVNISIMRAFVKMKDAMATHRKLAHRINELEAKFDVQFRIVFKAIRKLLQPPVKQKPKIGFVSKIYL